MKKNVYLTILTIVTVFCIIIGSVYHILGWGFSFLDRIFDYPFFSSEKKSAGSLIQSGVIELDDFTSISADVNVMDLNIEPGNAATIDYSCNSRLEPKYNVKNDTLYLTQGSVHNLWGNKKCTVTITVPNDQYYELFDISADVGDVDIQNISGQKLSLDADVGDIDIERCSFDDVDIQADVGDVDVDNCEFLVLSIDNSVGDIYVASAVSLSNYYIDMDTSIGEVEFNGQDYRRSYSQNGASDDLRVTLNNDTGDIDLTDR